jgi:hypothetical protein
MPAIFGIFLFAMLSACTATDTHCQSLDSILNDTDKANLAVLASNITQKIVNADRTEKNQ